MKKVLFSVVMGLLAVASYAQKQVTIKAGTIVPLQAVNQVKAADVTEGQTVDFSVEQDVMVDGVCAIPRGTLVKGVVSEARKSSLAGTKGRLTITIDRMNLDGGESVFFSNTAVRVTGKNRTPLAVVTGLFVWPCIFIPGTKAVMPAGYEVQAMVASNAAVTVR
ncbi:MAG: hypothetical protein IJ729_00520 [Alloprevotella sp.]|nr:hypothetical protein [Alloprevotella sp.]